MELDKALAILNHPSITTENERRPMRLVIQTLKPGSIGGTPCVDVEGINAGFDWDHGKLIVRPEKPLTALSPEDVAAIRKSAAEGQSWHAYQTHIAHKAQIAGLQAFAKEMISAAFAGADMDGGSIQEAAVKHGLLEAVEATEPCRDGCNCSLGDFPQTCYRHTRAMR